MADCVTLVWSIQLCEAVKLVDSTSGTWNSSSRPSDHSVPVMCAQLTVSLAVVVGPAL